MNSDLTFPLKRSIQMVKEKKMSTTVETRMCNDCKGTGQLREALAKAAIPYEALLMDVESRKWIAPEVWTAIETAVTAARAALSGKERR
jgi:hypothetical protein